MSGKYNILLVLCGGTICADVENRNGRRVKGIRREKEVLLRRNYENSDSCFAGDVCFDETENYGILSENMTIAKWNMLIEVMRSRRDYDKYDGIIFAHGTDTLAYTSSLFSLVLKELKKPVFLVSSHLALTEEGANGDDNFRAAADLICCGIKPGVYVTYRNPENNPDNIMNLHLGSRLLQCRNYENNFYSKGAVQLPSRITENSVASCLETLPDVEETAFDERAGFRSGLILSNCVLKIEPHVGLDYSAYNYDKYRAVIHGTYHSGTVCENRDEYVMNNSAESFLSIAGRSKRNFDIYISPADEKNVYESLDNILNYSDSKGGVQLLYGLTDEMAYVKLLVAYSAGFTGSEIREFMNADIAGEFAYISPSA